MKRLRRYWLLPAQDVLEHGFDESQRFVLEREVEDYIPGLFLIPDDGGYAEWYGSIEPLAKKVSEELTSQNIEEEDLWNAIRDYGDERYKMKSFLLLPSEILESLGLYDILAESQEIDSTNGIWLFHPGRSPRWYGNLESLIERARAELVVSDCLEILGIE